jgi:hypothetical protein
MNALSLQHNANTPVAEPAAFTGDIPNSLSKISVVRPNAVVAHAGSINFQDMTRPTLADLMRIAKVNHSLSLCGRRHHFFEAISLSMALSSICSAKSFFSLLFSASSTFNLRASETFKPPYLAFHL